MIKNIEIKNFRCFDKLKVLGFERVNLISGKNNAGKTALLEAIFLNSAPRPDSIFLLRQVRREQVSFSKTLPERTTDGGGSVTWQWSIDSAGLSSGNWQITAVATLGNKSRSTTDQLLLEVQ